MTDQEHGPLHYAGTTVFCQGGRNDTGDWERVTCPECLLSKDGCLERVSKRPETGTMQFEGDWSGVFIRGDNAFGYAMALERYLQGEREDFLSVEVPLQGLLALLKDSNECSEDHTSQRLRPWKECRRNG